MHLAFPVDVLIRHNLSARLDARHITLSPCSILVEKEAGRASLLNLVKHLLEMVGTIEEQHQYGDIYLGWLFHAYDAFRLISTIYLCAKIAQKGHNAK